MLRKPIDVAEAASSSKQLEEARTLMVSALRILDNTPVATDCDAHLDLAITILSEVIPRINAGEALFKTEASTLRAT